MDDQVNVYEAKAHFSKLLERVEVGEEIVIARNGRPVARLVPAQREGADEPRRLGGCEELIDIPEDFDEPDPEIEALFHGKATDSRRVD